jgi:hypothetical protein
MLATRRSAATRPPTVITESEAWQRELAGNMSSGKTIGTGAGVAGSGLIGYAIGGSPAGVLISMAAGGLIGNRLSNTLEGDAQTAAVQAAESSTGETITLRKTGPFFQTEAKGYATACGPLFTDPSGRTCRDVRETACCREGLRETWCSSATPEGSPFSPVGFGSGGDFARHDVSSSLGSPCTLASPEEHSIGLPQAQPIPHKPPYSVRPNVSLIMSYCTLATEVER